MWCSNHLVLSCSLQTMAGSEPRQSRLHYQKARSVFGQSKLDGANASSSVNDRKTKAPDS
ncbi:hypothetical protein F2Q69_00061024 [Brassica cretica]|uniref:Uncharacterized protein n=1 Tax=Brassica cretica TaxID=69181 RepID=A0A8S9RBZ4_BRACR|nr:hypothetical protein F2Q69_00061024 [Brassica cretica]